MYQIRVNIVKNGREWVAEVIRGDSNIDGLRFVGYGLSKSEAVNRSINNGWLIEE